MKQALKGTTITVLLPIEEFADNANWSRERIEKWITNCGGRAIFKLHETTTHLVCGKKTWTSQPEPVQAALAAKDQGHGIKIVTPDWLEKALRDQCKPKEGPYLWEKLNASIMKAQKAADRAAERAEKEAGRPGNIQGLMAEVFQQSTEMYLDPKEKRKIEKQLEKERAEAYKAAEEEKAAKKAEEKKRKEQSAVFAKGAKKAFNEIGSDNHHIYVDETGFHYDIKLTKVDVKTNRNERVEIRLKIYESNILPHTYATNVHFAGSGIIPHNDLVAAIGCPFATAFRAFRRIFKEKTRVNWDDRIAYAVERVRLEKRRRGEATGSPEGTQRGQPVSESGIDFEEAMKGAKEEEFSKRAFAYHPPLYGPRGVLPDKVKETYAEIGPPMVPEDQQKGREEIELWMSGTNSAGISPSQGLGGQQNGEGGELVGGGTTADGRSGVIAGTTDFAQFMSGALDAAGGPSALASGAAEVEDDFGLDTTYPFEVDPDVEKIFASPVEQASEDTNNARVEAGGPGPEDETQSFGHTQLAEDARAKLEDMMNAKGEETTSVLGKRKASPEEDTPVKKQRTPSDPNVFLDVPEIEQGKASPTEEAAVKTQGTPEHVKSLADASETVQDGESYMLAHVDGPAADSTPRKPGQGEEANGADVEQLQREMDEGVVA